MVTLYILSDAHHDKIKVNFYASNISTDFYTAKHIHRQLYNQGQ